MAAFNAEFGVEPVSESLYVPYKSDASLEDIFCVKQTRKMDSAGAFSFNGTSFQVLDEGYPLISARVSITVMASMDGAVRVLHKGRVFNTIACEKQKATRKVAKAKNVDIQESVKPHLLHSSEEWKKYWHYEDYNDTLAFLYMLFFKPCA